MDEGRIVAWHKRVGDPVAAGDVLVTDGVDKLQPGTKVAVRTPNNNESSLQAQTP